MQKGSVIIVSGPSGAGKGTVIHEVLKRLGDVFFSVSMTTREPRPGEVSGVDYHFVSEDEYKKILDADAFLETASVHGAYYGTPSIPVLNAVAQGQDALLDIDVQGAEQVKKKCPDAVTVFLMPPSMEVLESRLRGRQTESEEKICTRLANARKEVREAHKYQYVVVNNDLQEAIDELTRIVLASRCRSLNKADDLADIISTFE